MADLSVMGNYSRANTVGGPPPLDTPTFGAVLAVCGQASRAAVKPMVGTRVQLLTPGVPPSGTIPVSTQGTPYSAYRPATSCLFLKKNHVILSVKYVFAFPTHEYLSTITCS